MCLASAMSCRPSVDPAAVCRRYSPSGTCRVFRNPYAVTCTTEQQLRLHDTQMLRAISSLANKKLPTAHSAESHNSNLSDMHPSEVDMHRILQWLLMHVPKADRRRNVLV